MTLGKNDLLKLLNDEVEGEPEMKLDEDRGRCRLYGVCSSGAVVELTITARECSVK